MGKDDRSCVFRPARGRHDHLRDHHRRLRRGLDLGSPGPRKKQIWLSNTAVANGLKYKVLVYLSNASSGALEKEFVAETTLAAAGTDEFILERAYSKIVIQVKAAVGSSQATYQIDYTGGQT